MCCSGKALQCIQQHALFVSRPPEVYIVYIQPWLHSVSFNALVTITMTTALKAPQKSYVFPNLPVTTDSALFWLCAVDESSSQIIISKNPHVFTDLLRFTTEKKTELLNRLCYIQRRFIVLPVTQRCIYKMVSKFLFYESTFTGTLDAWCN